MNSRRKFLRNGSLAASVMLTAKPFKLLAETVSPFYKGNTGNSVVLLHTGNATEAHFSATAGVTAAVKKASGNVLLFNAPAMAAKKDAHVKLTDLIKAGGYDALLAHHEDAADAPMVNCMSNESLSIEPARIFHKGDVKVGVLGITQPATAASFNEINRLAKILKEERNCNLVVCISALGYENKKNTDDKNLAKQSAHIDVIISGNNDTHVPSSVLINSKGAEVLVNSAGNQHTAIGQIEVGFDNAGNKNRISFGAQAINEVPVNIHLS